MTERPRPRHFSMIRDLGLADVFTLCNAFAGTISMLATMKYLVGMDTFYLWLAFGMLPIALFFDVMDGRVARLRKKVSLLGQELDSLSDAVSFGVAPAALAFALGMRGLWDACALVYFVGCGISRLARYNVTASRLSDDRGKVRYFEGTPIPSSLIVVAVFAVLASQGRTGPRLPFGSIAIGPGELHPLVLLYVLSGSAMISKTLHIPKP